MQRHSLARTAGCDLLSNPHHTLETLALREGKTERSIRMILSLACWLDELMTNSSQTTEALAAREGKTERSIRNWIS